MSKTPMLTDAWDAGDPDAAERTRTSHMTARPTTVDGESAILPYTATGDYLTLRTRPQIREGNALDFHHTRPAKAALRCGCGFWVHGVCRLCDAGKAEA